MRLGDVTAGRDNNFNLLRVLAALSVVVSHSFNVISGDPRLEPVYRSVGMSLGSIAVDVFFVTSGLLVTGSLVNRRSIVEFFWGRALRILPGLWVMLILLAFVVGPMFTAVTLREYFTSPTLVEYLLRCGTIVTNISNQLPGVFTDNPRRGVNNPLWTIPYEVYMYTLIACFWLAARRMNRTTRQLAVFVLVFAAAAGAAALTGHFKGTLDEHRLRISELIYMFFSGSAAFFFRDHVKLTSLRMLLLATAIVAAGFINAHAFYVAYILFVPYLLLHLAYVPGGMIRRFNGVGDFSYGVYIYAFPVQQVLVATIPGISPLGVALYAGSVALLLAYLSWNFVEEPALHRRSAFVALSRSGLASLRRTA